MTVAVGNNIYLIVFPLLFAIHNNNNRSVFVTFNYLNTNYQNNDGCITSVILLVTHRNNNQKLYKVYKYSGSFGINSKTLKRSSSLCSPPY